MFPAGTTPDQEREVNDIIDSDIDGGAAVARIADMLGVSEVSGAEYVAVTRTGNFDLKTSLDDDELPATTGPEVKPTPEPDAVAIHEHGELGPVVGDPAHDFLTQ